MTLHRKPIEVDGAWLLTEHDGKTLGAKQASVGQWIVLDDGVLKVLTADECDAMYEEVD